MATTYDKEIEGAVERKLASTGRGTAAPPTTRASIPLSPMAPARPPSHPGAAPAAPAARPRRSAATVVRFSPLLAEAEPATRRYRKILVIVSVTLHVVLFVAIVLMPKRADSIESPSLPIEIALGMPAPPAPESFKPPAPKPLPPKPKPEPKHEEPPPPPVEVAKPAPKPVIPEVEPAPPPVVKAAPPKPRPEVKTGLLDEAPSGPAIVASRNSRSTIVASGFDGAAGAPSTAPRPGRAVETAAFDTAPAKTRAAATSGGSVQTAGFDRSATAAAPKKAEAAPAGPATIETDVEILSKPRPVYTDEARGLRIEGDVVLDVVFEAGGIVRVLGVSRGLGHGLDEAAIVAAKKIQFNPARRDGRAVDHQAKLRVVFRLA